MGRRTAGQDPTTARVESASTPRGECLEKAYFHWRDFDPAMLEGGVNAPLANELVTYRDHLDEILKHQGQFVVLKGDVIDGYHPNRRAAAAAVGKFGVGPVLIKKERGNLEHLDRSW